MLRSSQAAIAAGWQGSGCDFDPVTIRNALARGIDVREGGIEAWGDQFGAFDAVTISHVIEHVHDPRATLALAWKLLKPGGMIYVETPNLDALGHDIHGRNWRGSSSRGTLSSSIGLACGASCSARNSID